MTSDFPKNETTQTDESDSADRGSCSPSEWDAGTLVSGNFQLIRRIGTGGMGDVFSARDLQLGRRVAIKALRLPEGIDDTQFVSYIRLFRRDAVSTARLSHPNIVTLFQFDVWGSTPYMVLEHIRGHTLSDLMKESTPPIATTLNWMLGIADAMVYAHGQDVIHRDLKPANIMVDLEGRVKILDFGVTMMRVEADVLEDDFRMTRDELNAHLGTEPFIAGTPAYMAPEQLRGDEQAGRIDVWAFGVILYQCLVGKRPFRSRAKVADRKNPSWDLPEGVTPELLALVQRCLSFDAESRFENFEVLREALQSCILALRPSLKPTASKRNTLPYPVNQFVGRADEFLTLDSLFFDQNARLVTLHGPGGVGKTRLATEWAYENSGKLDGVYFCDLSEARTELDVLEAIAVGIDVPLSGRDPKKKLKWALLGRGKAVLILDNCEQVVALMASLISDWMKDVFELKLLVTTRELLGVRGERALILDPLGLGAENSDARLDDPGDAEALYQVRARETEADWTCPPDEQHALRTLLARLDGLPLAIELAAARARLMAPSRILSRLVENNDGLRTNLRDLPERQATLHGAIAWSWDLLDEAERSTLAQLAIFEGGFTLEAAEDTVLLQGAARGSFIIDVIESLVRKSLVRWRAAEQRFELLETIRAFARVQMKEASQTWMPADAEDTTADRIDALKRRYCEHYSFFGGPAMAAKTVAIVQQTSRERENLLAASRYAVELNLRTSLVGCGIALMRYFERGGPFARGLSLAELLLGMNLRPSDRVKTLQLTGVLQMRMAKWPEARASWEEALRISLELSDPTSQSRALMQLGLLSDRQGDADGAEAALLEALALCGDTDFGVKRTCIGNLGNIAVDRCDYDEAEKFFREAVALSRRPELSYGMEVWVGNLGVVEYHRGRFDSAKEFYAQAIEGARLVENRGSLSIWLGNFADLEMMDERYEAAHDLYTEALAHARDLGERFLEGVALGKLGVTAKERGRYDIAEQQVREARSIAREIGDDAFGCEWEGNIGDILFRRDGTPDALPYIERTVELAKANKDPRSAARWIGLNADIFVSMDRKEEALQLYKEGIILAEGVDEIARAIDLTAATGVLQLNEGNLEKAALALSRCDEYLKNFSARSLRRYTRERLDELRAGLG